MKRLIPRLFILLLFAATAASPLRPAGAEQTQARVWTGVRSQNFFVAGEAGEKDLRRVAVRLEEYRAAFSRLLSPEHFDAGVPTTVIVFPDDAAYNPFKPFLGGRRAGGVAGYFQPGADVNYITVTLDPDFELDTLLHEYTHLLVNNHFRVAPLWLKEGLAEFYSTARLSTDRRRVTLGEPPGRRARELRGRTLIPLNTLFAVDQTSPYYFEPVQRGLFYAESWALVHYLLEARGGERRDGLDRFTSMLAEGSTAEDALHSAFGIGVAEAEAGLADYVRLERYHSSAELFERPLDFDSQLTTVPLAEAEGLALLGDLLLHTDRDANAEGYLLRAVALDPNSAAARVSLGVLRLRQNRADEAREELQKAATLAPANHLARYYLAEALNRDDGTAAPEQSSIKAFEERTDAIRAELRRAIELAPGFIEPYKLLATVEMERGDRPEEAAAVLTRASALAPRRADLTLLLAQARLLAGRDDDARKLAEPIALRAADARLREQAGVLLARIVVRREEAERLRAQAAEEARADAEATPAQPCDMPLRGGPQYKRLRFEGAQVCGRLSEIECDKAGVVFNIMTDAGAILRLHAGDLSAVRFVTYTTAVKTGRIACGLRETAARALVTYRPKHDERASTDGEAVAVEFVPEDWNR
jgi:tetratricopeptide (TPR) repeat protein